MQWRWDYRISAIQRQNSKKICRDKTIYGDLREELLPIGRVGLVIALKKYDADKGMSIEAYVYLNVKNEINWYLRNIVGANPNGKKRAEFDALHIRYSDNTERLNANNIDIFYNSSNNIDRIIECKDLLQKIYSQLPERYVEIIKLHDIKGFTFDEISQQLGYTYQNAHALYHRAIIKFKRIYNELIKHA